MSADDALALVSEINAGADAAPAAPAKRQHYADALEAFQRGYFDGLLRWHKGKVSAVAIHAGLDRTYAYRLLKGLGLEPKAYKDAAT